MKTHFSEIEALIRERYSNYTPCVTSLFIHKGGKATLNGNYSCHAGIRYGVGTKVIGIMVDMDNNDCPVIQSYLQWLSSDLSVYKPMFDHLGKGFHVVKEGEKIIGFMMTTNISTKVLMSFFKATRSCYEQYVNLKFWKKYYIDFKGEKSDSHGALTFWLSYFLSVDGNLKTPNHCVFENGGVDLSRFIINQNNYEKKQKDWQLGEKTLFKVGEYAGEFGHTLGGNFTTKNIRKAEEKILKTRFWGIYNKRKGGSLNEKDIIQFYKDAVDGVYGYV